MLDTQFFHDIRVRNESKTSLIKRPVNPSMHYGPR
jgi:hypothetical protein